MTAPRLLPIVGLILLVPAAHAQEPPRAAAAQPGGERYALLVGVGRYVSAELRPLPYAERDVTALAEVLRDSDYRPGNVVLLTPTAGASAPRFMPLAQRIRQELRLLLQHRTAADTVLIAFAGHGVQWKGDPNAYFCPADAQLDDKKTLVSLTEVYQELEKCPAGLKVLLVDACRNDPVRDATRARAAVDLESVTRPAVAPAPGGVAAFFSCSEKEKAYENEDLHHGVFFHYVIEGLRGAAAGNQEAITVPSLGEYVSRRVSDYVRAKYGAAQTPELVGKVRGFAPLVMYDEVTRLYRRGRNAVLKEHDYARAITDLTEVLRRSPEHVGAYVARGYALTYERQLDRALADFSTALRLQPENADALRARGWLYIEKADPERAVADLAQGLRVVVPQDSWTYLTRGALQAGLARCGRGSYDQALADYTEASRLDPSAALPVCCRANVHSLRQHYDQAIADATEAIRLDPKYPSPYVLRARAYRSKGATDQAIADFTEALRRYPRYFFAYDERGRLYYDRGEYDRAIRDWTEALRLDPNHALGYAARGMASWGKGAHDQVIADLSEAVRRGVRTSAVFATRSASYTAKGETDKAVADATEAIRLDPKNVVAYNNRGWTYFNKRTYDSAVADLTEALRLNPKYTQAYINRAWTFFEKGAYDRAVTDLTQAIHLEPNRAQLYTWRAKLYTQLGDKAKAEADMRKAEQLQGKK